MQTKDSTINIKATELYTNRITQSHVCGQPLNR